MQSSPVPCYLIPLRPKYLPHLPCTKYRILKIYFFVNSYFSVDLQNMKQLNKFLKGNSYNIYYILYIYIYITYCIIRYTRDKIFLLSSATLYINFKSYFLLLFIYLTTFFDPTRGHLQVIIFILKAIYYCMFCF